MIRLTVQTGPETGLTMESDKGSVSLGKAPSNHLVLTDRYVSRYHGQILWDGLRYVYIDLHSSNGSALRRGGRVMPVDLEQNFQVRLEDGDFILLGDRENPTVVCVEWTPPCEADKGAPFADAEEPAIEVRDRTDVTAWKTIEGALSTDARAVTGLYRLGRILTDLKEGSSPESLFETLAEALFDTFPSATHVMVAEAAQTESGSSAVATVHLKMQRCRNGTAGSADEAILFSRSLIRKALCERRGFLFSACGGGASAEPESVARAHISSSLLVPFGLDEDKKLVLQVDNRSGDGQFTLRDLEILTVYSVHASQIENLYRRLNALADEKRALKAENVRLRFQIRTPTAKPEEIVGVSPAMQTLFGLLERVADLPTTVLIEGETGTGKELVARALHYNSRFRKGPFVAVNCAALPETLLESELFGHRKGAFTGAQEDKRGLFELADGGTLFLDELSEMAHSTQTRLLRVLQDGVFRRLGEERERRASVRVIGATNKHLKEEVANGRFRQDLYYRLSSLLLSIPPLRARQEDIPPLCSHLTRKISEKLGIPSGGLTWEALEALKCYDFPGNVRELENILEGAIAQAGGRPLRVEDLPVHLRLSAVEPSELRAAVPTSWEELKEMKEALWLDLEKRFVAHWLEKSKGVVTAAAKGAGVNRCQFHQLIAKTGLDPDRFR